MVPHPGNVPLRVVPDVGILGTAILTATLSLAVIKRLGLHAPDGTPLGFPPKALGNGVRYVAGGTISVSAGD